MKPFILTSSVLFILFAGITQNLNAQSVSISPVLTENPDSFHSYQGPEEGENWHIRLDQNGGFVSTSPALDFDYVMDYDFSPDKRHLAIIREDNSRDDNPFIIEIYNKAGHVVGRHNDLIDLEPGDPSLKLYLNADAGIVVRDNIVGFSLYDFSRLYIDRLSNASGSVDGETMSRLVSSRDGSQIYAYNPRIIRGDGFSSRISRLYMDGRIENIYSDPENEILNLTATDDGEFVYAVMENEHGQREVRKIDREGKVVASHRSEMDSPGFYVQPSIGTVTWFENNQAQTYNLESGDRLANAYFRQQNIVFAKYSPEDNIVFTITGSRNNRDGFIDANGIRIVDLSARELIHSDDLSIRLNFKPEEEPRLYRVSENSYQLLGVSHALQVDINR